MGGAQGVTAVDNPAQVLAGKDRSDKGLRLAAGLGILPIPAAPFRLLKASLTWPTTTQSLWPGRLMCVLVLSPRSVLLISSCCPGSCCAELQASSLPCWAGTTSIRSVTCTSVFKGVSIGHSAASIQDMKHGMVEQRPVGQHLPVQH